MNMVTVIVDLGQNIALLLALAFIYSLLTPTVQRISPPVRSLLLGLVYGLIGILSVLTAIPVAPGFNLDGRAIIITMAGYAGGPIAGVLSAALVSAARLSMTGGGALPAVPSALTYAVVGIVFYEYERRRHNRVGAQWFLVMGLVSVVSLYGWIVALTSDQRIAFIQQQIVPILILYPLGTWLLGIVIRNQQRHYEIVEALAEERSRLRTLIDNLPDYIFIKDRGGRFIVSNLAHARAAQAPTDQALLGKTASSFFPDALATQYIEDDRRVLQGATIIDQERRTVDASGNPIWVTTTKVPMRNNLGEIAGLIGISHDVTTRKKAEDALRQSETKYRQIIETATEGIWMIDAADQTTFVNPRMAAMLGYEVDEMLGRSPEEFAEGEAARNFAASMDRRQQGISEEYDIPFRKKNGDVVSTIVSATPVLDEQGAYAGSLAMITDITDRKRVEAQELQLAAERQRVQVLNQFINNISHDFRTPLTILQTSLFLLRQSANEQQQRRIDVLEAQVKRLTRLFDEMLDVYSLENHEPIRLSPTNVNSVVQAVTEHYQPDADQKRQTLQFDAGHDLPSIALDETLFARALAHLVDNALRFTPEAGTITMRTRAGQAEVVVAVQDTGEGIAPVVLPHIFEHFYRADSARSSLTGGSGLGLTIVRNIVEAHGGRITVESVLGQGTVFRIHLPIESAKGDSILDADAAN